MKNLKTSKTEATTATEKHIEVASVFLYVGPHYGRALIFQSAEIDPRSWSQEAIAAYVSRNPAQKWFIKK